MHKESGYSLIEMLGVVLIVMLLSYLGFGAFSGVRERNAVVTVATEVKHVLDRYRQKAIDKGVNFGLIFSDDGIYVFEDNGGDNSDPFINMNNFRIDSGEFSDKYTGDASGDSRRWRRVTDTVSEFQVFTRNEDLGEIKIMTTDAVDLRSGRSGDPYDISGGTDITSSARPTHNGSTNSPFESGTLALFFSPDGFVYLKDPSAIATPQTKYHSRLGSGSTPAFYVVRVAYDNETTDGYEMTNYYEIIVNRYGATTKVRWNYGGSTWNANVE